jgi:hypothetical protein
MAVIKMAFSVWLESQLIPGIRVTGPLFHRFLPDGKNDAVVLTPEGAPHEIRVWFARNAKKVDGFLKWDRDGSDFDENIMRRQGVLEGGPLRGEMLMPDVSQNELTSLLRNPKALNEKFGQDTPDDPNYIALGKRVIAVLQPRLSNFVSTLRNQYGQYWLEELRPWDSRRSTLGTYCSSNLGLQWWNDVSSDWRRFLPTNSGAMITVQRPPGRGEGEYLTELDWRRFQRTHCLDDVSTELQLLGNATRALDFGEYRQAFIEVMSALELVIARRLSSGSDLTKRAIQSFLDRETQSAQVAVVLLATGADDAEIEQALCGLKVRNRVAHEGYLPTSVEAGELRPLVKTIQRLAGLEELKTPAFTTGNSLSAP